MNGSVDSGQENLILGVTSSETPSPVLGGTVPTEDLDKVISTEVGPTTPGSATPVLEGSTMHPSKLQGAWTKPLFIVGNSSHDQIMEMESTGKDHSEWPTLSSRPNGKARAENEQIKRAKTPLQVQRIKIPTDKTRFPWAARMNPQSRNLHRARIYGGWHPQGIYP